MGSPIQSWYFCFVLSSLLSKSFVCLCVAGPLRPVCVGFRKRVPAACVLHLHRLASTAVSRLAGVSLKRRTSPAEALIFVEPSVLVAMHFLETLQCMYVFVELSALHGIGEEMCGG